MCGIFAYTGVGPPDPQLLLAAAEGAGRRGPHGCGWVTYNPGTPPVCVRHLGPLGPHRDALTAITDTRVLGHARLATVGDWQAPEQLQPALAGAHAVAHNGVIDNPDDLAPDAITDSYALAAAYAAMRGHGVPPTDTLAKLAAVFTARSWVVVVLDVDGQMYAHRRYHPLHRLATNVGTYLSSWAFHPDARPVAEDAAVTV